MYVQIQLRWGFLEGGIGEVGINNASESYNHNNL